MREITGSGSRAFALHADLSQVAQVEAMVRDAETRSGGLSVLVNSASNYLRVPFEQMTEAVWDASLDTNLKAPFLLSWHVGRAMRARGVGRIVNVVDWAAERPYRDYLAVLRRRWWVVPLVALVAVAGAWLVNRGQTPQYRSTARLLVTPGRPDLAALPTFR